MNAPSSANTPEFNFQQQNAFTVDDFSVQSQNGQRRPGTQGQAQTPQMASQMTPLSILQQGQRGSESQSVTPSQNQSQDQQNFMSILSPEQILARAAGTQSQQQHLQQQQPQYEHDSAINANIGQSQANNLGGFMGSW